METVALAAAVDCSDNCKGQPTSDQSMYKIRKATRKDVPVIMKFFAGLALDQKQSISTVGVSEKDLLRDGFGDHQYFHCLIGEHVNSDSISPVGFVLYYFGYAYQTGRLIYLEDLYVESDHRRRGVATMMMKELCKIAVDNECHRIQWVTLGWNKDAASVYDKWGSIPRPDLLTYRMAQDTMLKHASTDDNSTSS